MMTTQKMVVAFDKEGNATFVHSDEAMRMMMPIMKGKPDIRRVSRVEADEDGNFWADLAPVGGPKLGPFPPDQYKEAIRREVEWLEKNYIGQDLPLPDAAHTRKQT